MEPQRLEGVKIPEERRLIGRHRVNHLIVKQGVGPIRAQLLDKGVQRGEASLLGQGLQPGIHQIFLARIQHNGRHIAGQRLDELKIFSG